jgi:hypothetical protein
VQDYLLPKDEPNPLEKQNQLSRILLDKRVKKFPKLSELLQFLVEWNLQGKVPSQEIIGIKVFGQPLDWVPLDHSCVRTGISSLSKLLETYYTTEGLEDRLNVTVEKSGTGYRAVFSYNLRNPVEQNLRRGLRFIGIDAFAACKYLDAVLNVEPTHAEAFVGRVENELWGMFYGYRAASSGFIDMVERQTLKALSFDERCWRAHIVMGAVFCCRLQWENAAKAFEWALDCSRGQTEAHPWYAGFLMARGETDVALQLVRAKASEPSDSVWPQLTYMIFLYAARRYDEAYRVMSAATPEDHNSRFFHVMEYFILIARGFPSNAERIHLGALTELRFEGYDLPYPVMKLVCMTHELDPGYPEYDFVKGGIEDLTRSKLQRWTEPEGPKPEVLSWKKDEIRIAPFQKAIAYLAIEDVPKAIENLKCDLMEGHPLLCWLHLWPYFDPLKPLPEFQTLIKRMKLPTKRRKITSGSVRRPLP